MKSDNPRKHKERIGVVLSNKMHKTIVVQVERRTRHSVYRKVVRRVSKLKAHDEKGLAKVGDRVRVAESRPLSKEKRWHLMEVLKSP